MLTALRNVVVWMAAAFLGASIIANLNDQSAVADDLAAFTVWLAALVVTLWLLERLPVTRTAPGLVLLVGPALFIVALALLAVTGVNLGLIAP